MLYSYGVTPLKEDHFSERCEDILQQVRDGVICMPLFSMTLVPEGAPLWDKVGPMAELYARYRDYLEPRGVSCGILVQASLGHGYKITDNPFRNYVNFKDGSKQFVCCPEDEAFLAHFSGVLKALAKARPAAIMLDDDFRMMMRPGKGCACGWHMAEFNRRAGLSMTREQLWAYIQDRGEACDLADIFREIQKDSLVKAARVFRSAIDEIDPGIQGINCTSGFVCESVSHTNPIFCGSGNPTMARIPNGSYAPFGSRGFSDLMRRSAICGGKLKKHGIQVILAETDTIPFNRYGKSASYLHAQYTVSILEGAQGAKHWLTRTSAYEPGSGRAYRKILGEYRQFYEALVPLAKEIRWVGINHVFAEQTRFYFTRPESQAHFIDKNIERMGLPFYYSDQGGEASMLEDIVLEEMTDAQRDEVLKGSLFLTAEAARELNEQGFGHITGVEVLPWTKGVISGEIFGDNIHQRCTAQKNPWELRITNNKTQAISYNVRNNGSSADILAPAVTVFPREDGKLTVVYCGSPDAEFNYMEGFAFLNESRKKQLTDLLKQANALPICCHGDEEICLRAGWLKDGVLLAALYPLGLDVLEDVTLYLKQPPQKMQLLCSDGSRQDIAFEALGGSLYRIQAELKPMMPLILFIT